jgi:hypothetical protein
LFSSSRRLVAMAQATPEIAIKLWPHPWPTLRQNVNSLLFYGSPPNLPREGIVFTTKANTAPGSIGELGNKRCFQPGGMMHHMESLRLEVRRQELICVVFLRPQFGIIMNLQRSEKNNESNWMCNVNRLPSNWYHGVGHPKHQSSGKWRSWYRYVPWWLYKVKKKVWEREKRERKREIRW